MKIKWISIALALAIFPIQSHAGEPFRVGIDVPEPKLLNKAEIDARVSANAPAVLSVLSANAAVVLIVLIDEQGAVTDVTPWQYDDEILEVAKACVKE
jgi:hypothetical protein